MTQIRDIDYRAPLDPRGENRKWIGIVPAGVYAGFRVHSDGTIDPGLLLTEEGIRIEETDTVSVEVPPGHPTLNRYDLIVCRHEYLETYPNLEAHYEVIEGTPSDDLNPPIPNLPEHAVLLAYGRMQPGETTWTHVYNASAPVIMRNLKLEADGYHVIHGDQSAILARHFKETDEFHVFMVASGSVSDGSLVELTAPSLTLTPNGILQLNAHLNTTTSAHAASSISVEDSEERFTAENVEAALAELAGDGRSAENVKGNADTIAQEIIDRSQAISTLQNQLNAHETESSAAHAASAISTQAISGTPFSLSDSEVQAALAALVENLNDRVLKSGDTFSGEVTFQNAVTLDADDADDVAFDDYVSFYRMVPPCAATYLQGTWSDDDWEMGNNGGGFMRTNASFNRLVLPIPTIPGAQITSVAAAMQNTDSYAHKVDIRLYRTELTADMTEAQDEIGVGYGNDKTVDQSGVFTLAAEQSHQMVTAIATDDPDNDPAPQEMTVDDVWRVVVYSQGESGLSEQWGDGHLIFKGLRVTYRRKKLLV